MNLVAVVHWVKRLSVKARTHAEERREKIRSGAPRGTRETDKVLRGCVDCGTSVHAMVFMVEDAVWLGAGLNKKQFCCEDCLSARLQRPLTINDYTKSIINLSLLRGYEMGLRAKSQEAKQHGSTD
uniref:Uncharacterized protein n=1 Tax=Pseudomonas phage HRDY3 TaxID=3236930 RepID=A0AB39CDN3_9VIRU